jgi:hypothetical protein
VDGTLMFVRPAVWAAPAFVVATAEPVVATDAGLLVTFGALVAEVPAAAVVVGSAADTDAADTDAAEVGVDVAADVSPLEQAVRLTTRPTPAVAIARRMNGDSRWGDDEAMWPARNIREVNRVSVSTVGEFAGSFL